MNIHAISIIVLYLGKNVLIFISFYRRYIIYLYIYMRVRMCV